MGESWSLYNFKNIEINITEHSFLEQSNVYYYGNGEAT